MPDKPFKRILLKLSGESLKGNRSHGIDPDSLDYMAEEIKQTQFIPVNPGSLLATSMVKSGFGIEGKVIQKSVKLLADLAVSKDYEGESGRYFDNDIGTFGAPHPDAQNTIFQAELIKNLARFH